MNSTIVIVEDDLNLGEFLQEILNEQGFVTYLSETGAQALKLIEKINPNLVLLDLGLPDIDGESVSVQIKKMFPQTPVIIITARDTTRDLVVNLQKGADDYIAKPFSNEELIARIKARLRRFKMNESEIKIKNIVLDTNSCEVKISDEIIELTHTEFELLHYLMTHPNQVLSREQILSHVWAQEPDIETRVVDVYIGYLRKKLEKTSKEKLIQTKRGFGYYIKD